MGRCRSHESMEYREAIMNALCENERIVRLMNPQKCRDKGELVRPQELPYKYIMPYELIPGTLTETGRYLSFDLSIYPNGYNTTYKNLQVDFFLLAHDSILTCPDLDMPGRERFWADLVICELDEMFCGDNPVNIGVGKFEFVSNVPKVINYARELPFLERVFSIIVYDFMDGKKYGK